MNRQVVIERVQRLAQIELKAASVLHDNGTISMEQLQDLTEEIMEAEEEVLNLVKTDDEYDDVDPQMFSGIITAYLIKIGKIEGNESVFAPPASRLKKRTYRRQRMRDYYYRGGKTKEQVKALSFDEFLEKYGKQIDKAVDEHANKKFLAYHEKKGQRMNDQYRQRLQWAIRYYTKKANDAKNRNDYYYWSDFVRKNVTILQGFEETIRLAEAGEIIRKGEYKEGYDPSYGPYKIQKLVTPDNLYKYRPNIFGRIYKE